MLALILGNADTPKPCSHHKFLLNNFPLDQRNNFLIQTNMLGVSEQKVLPQIICEAPYSRIQ